MMRRIGRPALLGALRDLAFPPVCPACGAETGQSGALCGACFADTDFIGGPICTQCGRPEPALGVPDPAFRCDGCLADPPPWRAGRAVAVYGGAARRLVMALKHGDRLDTVPVMARWMARAAASLPGRCDLIAPVPLHWRRRLARRFNQSAELARALAAVEGRPAAFAPGLLRRTRPTPSQQGRDREARTANVAGAFAPAPGLDLAGRSVLLVDDVMTSGATLAEAARCLLGAGAGHIDVLVMAVVPVSARPHLAGSDAGEDATPAPESPGNHPEKEERQ